MPRRNAKTATRVPRIPEPWERARAAGARVQVMHSRTHGVVSNKTRRRQERQRGYGEDS